MVAGPFKPGSPVIGTYHMPSPARDTAAAMSNRDLHSTARPSLSLSDVVQRTDTGEGTVLHVPLQEAASAVRHRTNFWLTNACRPTMKCHALCVSAANQRFAAHLFPLLLYKHPDFIQCKCLLLSLTRYSYRINLAGFTNRQILA